ncbi:hypothetical protein [Luedemannella helvata]|uniref:Lipoprotein n=1 Tax=Luedemannella helvata TaxID=349315 RepID=A0ABN2KIH5_9ACTN
MRRVIALTSAVCLALAVAACTGEPDADAPATPAPTSAAPAVLTMIRANSTCEHVGTTPAPVWVDDAGPGLPATQVRSAKGDVVAAIFGEPLRAAPRDDGRNNKILFIVGKPRNGEPLRVTATPAGGGAATTATQEANSGPGEIYPTIVDVPAPGCWHLDLSWAGNTDSMDLLYAP